MPTVTKGIAGHDEDNEAAAPHNYALSCVTSTLTVRADNITDNDITDNEQAGAEASND